MTSHSHMPQDRIAKLCFLETQFNELPESLSLEDREEYECLRLEYRHYQQKELVEKKARLRMTLDKIRRYSDGGVI